MIVGLPSMLRMLDLGLGLDRLAACPASDSAADELHREAARLRRRRSAPPGSCPSPSSKRDLNVNGPSKAPEPSAILPLPSFRLPLPLRAWRCASPSSSSLVVFDGSLAACGASASCSSSPPGSRSPTRRSSRSPCRRSSPSSTRRSRGPPRCSASTRSCSALALPARGAAAGAGRASARRRAGVRRRLARLRPGRLDRRRCWSLRGVQAVGGAGAAGRRVRAARRGRNRPPRLDGGGDLRLRRRAGARRRADQALDWRAIFLVQAPHRRRRGARGAGGRPRPRRPKRRRARPPRAARPGLSRSRWCPRPSSACCSCSCCCSSPAGRSRRWPPPRRSRCCRRPPSPPRASAARPATRAAAGRAARGGRGARARVAARRASLWWTVLPQLMAGAGLGLALPALAGELLPEDTPEQAAWLLSLRHAASPPR